MSKFLKPVVIISIAWSLFQVYAALAKMPLPDVVALPMHVAFALALAFIAFPFRKAKLDPLANPEGPPPNAKPKWYDYALAALSLGLGIYMWVEAGRIAVRIPGISPITSMDIIVGILFILLTLEASRRATGWAMTILATVFLVYQFAGQALATIGKTIPLVGMVAHRGEVSASGLMDFLDAQILQQQGIFGVPTSVSFNAVFYFVLFGAFLDVSGGGQMFIDFAMRLVGRYRGGPAKVAIVASSLMGSISGSAVANVVGTGIFTIPLMKRGGYKPAFAGAVEAAASTGGQIMPPIMGAGAFLIAQFMGIPYYTVILGALIPAVIYYTSVYFMVDLRAAKMGLRGMTDAQINVTWKSLLIRFYMWLPIIYLVTLVVQGRSLSTTAMKSIGLIIIMMLVEKLVLEIRKQGLKAVFDSLSSGFIRSLEALDNAAKSSVQVAIPCAVAGIIVGVVGVTGLGVKFTSIMLALTGGLLVPALLLVMVAVMIMGMGMPTTSAYLMGIILGIPALHALGVTGLSAHLFIFYFACMSMLTPPVALAAYAASSIAGADMWETGWTGFKLALAGFIVPYAFVFNPAMVFDGPLIETFRTTITGLVGAWALAGGVTGYLFVNSKKWETALLLVAALMLIVPDSFTDVGGLIIIITLATRQYLQGRNAARLASVKSAVR